MMSGSSAISISFSIRLPPNKTLDLRFGQPLHKRTGDKNRASTSQDDQSDRPSAHDRVVTGSTSP